MCTFINSTQLYDCTSLHDGKKFKVSMSQASVLRRLLTAPSVKPQVKAQFTKDLQQSQTIEKFLQAEDMVKLFVSTYGIDKAEPSNY